MMFVRTERLFLRPAWIEDAAELTRAIAHEPVARMLAAMPWPYSEADARRWIETERDPRSPALLVTVPNEGARIVGSIALHREDGFAEAGYWIEPGSWNRGYASEALSGLLAVAPMLGHRRIAGRHAADNPASGRVLRKMGFTPTNRARPFRSPDRDTSLQGPQYALDLDGVAGPQGRPMRCAA
jgi:RimJ/RimL family protein N-acetyltransferase